MTKRSLSRDQADLIVARLLSEPLWSSPTTEEILAATEDDDLGATDLLFRHISEIVPDLPKDDGLKLAAILERIVERLGAQASDRSADAANLRAEVGDLRLVMSDLGAAKAEGQAMMTAAKLRHQARSAAVEAATAQVDLVVERRVSERAAAMPAPAAPAIIQPPAPAVAAAPSIPVVEPAQPVPVHHYGDVLTSWQDAFFSAKQYSPHSVKQSEATVRLWTDINGDRPPAAYTRRDVFEFQRKLRELPALHGKGNRSNHVDVKLVIARAAGQKVDRLSEKTIQRHFSLMRQFFKHIGEEHVTPRLFDAVEHHLLPSTRGAWSEEDLDKLLRARWNFRERDSVRISEECHGWMVAIGGYTGCRVEEIARLRTEDFVFRDGFHAFQLRIEYEDVPTMRRPSRIWTTKSPAGLRLVPIHKHLIDVGILDLVKAARTKGEDRILSLHSTGTATKLSAGYSREFSRLKNKDIAVGPDTVFHSFRHSVETILASTVFKQQWIDKFMGHKGARKGEKRSVGELVYEHGLTPETYKLVADAVLYPPQIDPVLLLRRIRGEVSW